MPVARRQRSAAGGQRGGAQKRPRGPKLGLGWAITDLQVRLVGRRWYDDGNDDDDRTASHKTLVHRVRISEMTDRHHHGRVSCVVRLSTGL